jgi:hypothetical protein
MNGAPDDVRLLLVNQAFTSSHDGPSTFPKDGHLRPNCDVMLFLAMFQFWFRYHEPFSLEVLDLMDLYEITTRIIQ